MIIQKNTDFSGRIEPIHMLRLSVVGKKAYEIALFLRESIARFGNSQLTSGAGDHRNSPRRRAVKCRAFWFFNLGVLIEIVTRNVNEEISSSSSLTLFGLLTTQIEKPKCSDKMP